MCTREVQNSIKDSVHRLLKNQIRDMGLADYFNITTQSIKGKASGSEFIFKGLQEYSVDNIKSLEDVDDVWLAEAQNLTKNSWNILEPTIRKEGSEIFADFNPDEENDFMYQYFVANTPPPGAIVRKQSYRDNPYFPEKLEKQRLFAYSKTIDPDISKAAREQNQLDYDNIWDGVPKKISMAAIFRNRVQVHDFDTPRGTRFYFGADFGFNDPATLMRMWITTNQDGSEELWIDYEAYDNNVEMDDMPAFYTGGMSQDGSLKFEGVPDCKLWPIKGDSSRPETISYLARKGFTISAAKKWKGSVEDGITHLKAFKLIHIHTRCPNTQQEAKDYCYEVDKAGNILPSIVDANNHCWDAVRYGLDDFISDRGGIAIWEKLGQM